MGRRLQLLQVVTGIATPCVGVGEPEGHIADVPVHVTILNGSRTVASQTVRGSDMYRLTVPPGHYLVTSNALGAEAPTRVRVKAGALAEVNLYSAAFRHQQLRTARSLVSSHSRMSAMSPGRVCTRMPRKWNPGLKGWARWGNNRRPMCARFDIFGVMPLDDIAGMIA